MHQCPPVHSHADHVACPYGGAGIHSHIRALWMHQLSAWGLYPYFLERRHRRPAPGAGEPSSC